MMIWRLYQMNTMNQAISEIGVVPVIKLNNPERDAAPLAKALCAGGVPVAEVTFRAAGAPLAIKVMKETCPTIVGSRHGNHPRHRLMKPSSRRTVHCNAGYG